MCISALVVYKTQVGSYMSDIITLLSILLFFSCFSHWKKSFHVNILPPCLLSSGLLWRVMRYVASFSFLKGKEPKLKHTYFYFTCGDFDSIWNGVCMYFSHVVVLIPLEMECACIKATFLMVYFTSYYPEWGFKGLLTKRDAAMWAKEASNFWGAHVLLSLGMRIHRQEA